MGACRQTHPRQGVASGHDRLAPAPVGTRRGRNAGRSYPCPGGKRDTVRERNRRDRPAPTPLSGDRRWAPHPPQRDRTGQRPHGGSGQRASWCPSWQRHHRRGDQRRAPPPATRREAQRRGPSNPARRHAAAGAAQRASPPAHRARTPALRPELREAGRPGGLANPARPHAAAGAAQRASPPAHGQERQCSAQSCARRTGPGLANPARRHAAAGPAQGAPAPGQRRPAPAPTRPQARTAHYARLSFQACVVHAARCHSRGSPVQRRSTGPAGAPP